MKILFAAFVLAYVRFVYGGFCRFPRWPSEFKWSSAGPVNGYTCMRITEPSDPHTWRDNYFCHKSGPGIQGIGMRWSYAGMYVYYLWVPLCIDRTQVLNFVMLSLIN